MSMCDDCGEDRETENTRFVNDGGFSRWTYVRNAGREKMTGDKIIPKCKSKKLPYYSNKNYGGRCEQDAEMCKKCISAFQNSKI